MRTVIAVGVCGAGGLLLPQPWNGPASARERIKQGKRWMRLGLNTGRGGANGSGRRMYYTS